MTVSQRILGPVIFAVSISSAIAYAISQSKDLQETTKDAGRMLFAIFSTPFILETTVALIGLLVVVSLSQWRVHKEGDGWVDMPSQRPLKPPQDKS